MQPDLSNIKQKIKGNRDIIDNLTTKIGIFIPGFSGFVEAAESYAADQLVRDFMADKIQKIKQEISDIMSSMSRDGKFEFLGGDALGLGLEKLFKKAKHADYGPSASASKLKVTEADKERLLEYDWRLLSNLDEFNDPVTTESPPGGEIRNR